ncbi:MAG: hypothetical protein JJ863_04540 [Deltaproteobacteria bacterium]|nr:hypothetical protein [Deltaproteobacteria bacterium]
MLIRRSSLAALGLLASLVGCSESTVSEPLDMARPTTDSGPTPAADLGMPVPEGGEPLEPLSFEVPEDGSSIVMKSTMPTGIEHADIYLLVDTTASLREELELLQRSIVGPSGLVARLREEIPDSRIGLGTFADYGVTPYGSTADGDTAYTHRVDPTDDIAALEAAVGALELGNGNDVAESMVPALWSMATGFGLAGPSGWTEGRRESSTWGECEAGAQGWPCFRPDAAALVIVVTDAISHNGPDGLEAYDDAMLGAAPPTWEATRVALESLGARVLFVTTDADGEATAMARTLATETGAVDDSGMPLVFPTSPRGPADIEPLVAGVTTLANRSYRMTLRLVTTEGSSLPQLVDSFAAGPADPALGCSAFTEGALVGPGRELCVELSATLDETIARGSYIGWLELLGDGRRLAARPIRIRVP